MEKKSNFQPIIKWTGSKRSQADEIIQYFPSKIDTYYEPFCGGASMMRRLLDSNIQVNHIVCSDLNKDLIDVWKLIQNRPDILLERYGQMFNELNSKNTIDEKRKYFEDKRFEYNMTHDPFIFFWIMRTCTNGMPRYNRKGEFNNSFHLSRNGITPENLRPILEEWFKKLNSKDVEFRNCSYENVLKEANGNDMVYMDPPYANVKKNQMYFGGLDVDKFVNELKRLNEKGVKYLLSFDGKSGNEDNTRSDLFEECGVSHVYIKSGNSSFKRVIGKDKHAIVYESLYMNFQPDKKEEGLW